MLRKTTLADFDFIYGLYMHPQVNPFLLYEQMNKEEFISIYNQLHENGYLYIYETSGTAAGMCKLVPQQYRNAHIVYLGGVAVHPSFAGRGEGLKMMNEITALAKQSGFLRIELSVASVNQKAIRLYEKAGFRKEGILKNFTYLKSENRFLDEVMMAYLM